MNMLERKSIHDIGQVFSAIYPTMFNHGKTRIIFFGDEIKSNSQRYQTFFTKGMRCAKCGIEGKYFAKEKRAADTRYHLNLYAVREDGQEVLMTKDHIYPRSKGGRSHLTNYQPMCEMCNSLKGDNVEKEDTAL